MNCMHLRSISTMRGRIGLSGWWRWMHQFLLVIWLLLLAATPTKGEGHFLADTKAVLKGCEDHWTLQDGASMPLLLQMTLCVDVRVVRPGAWVAFSYSSVHAPRPELGLEGDGGALYAWLLRVRHRFPIRLSPAQWHRVCLRRDVPRNSFSLEVDGNLVAERTVIAGAIPPQGSLWLGCRPRDKPPGATLGEVELYMFRMWADMSEHDHCEDGTVIGWRAPLWGVTSPRASQRDSNLSCDHRRLIHPAGLYDHRRYKRHPAPYGHNHPAAQCSVSQLCSSENPLFWMTVDARGSDVSKNGVNNSVSQAFSCNDPPNNCKVEKVDCGFSLGSPTPPQTCKVLIRYHSAKSACEVQNVRKEALQNHQLSILGDVQRVGQAVCEGVNSSTGRYVMCTSSSSLDEICRSNDQYQVTCSPQEQPPPQSCSRNAPRFCNCSAFCDSTSQFYALKINITNPGVTVDYLKNLFSVEKVIRKCNGNNCRDIQRHLKPAYLECHGEGATIQNIKLTSCMVILMMNGSIDVCELGKSLDRVIKNSGHISNATALRRMMVCGSSDLAVHSLGNYSLTWVQSANVSSEVCGSNRTLFKCKENETLAVLMSDENNCTQSPTVTSWTNQTTANASLQATTPTITITTTPSTTVSTTVSTTTHETTTVLTSTTSTEPELTTPSQEPQELQADQLLDLTEDASQLNSVKVARVVKDLEKLLDGPTISPAVGQKVINIISNLMEGDPQALSAMANRLIQLVDVLGVKLIVTDTEVLSASLLVLAVKVVDGTNFPVTSLDFFSTSDVEVRHRGGSRVKRSGSFLGSVALPSSLTMGLSPEGQNQANRVQFNFYTKPVLFQDSLLKNETLVSPVLAASVANLSISNLTENIQFTIQHTIQMNFTASCAFWDFTKNRGGGGWRSAGCFIVNTTAEETTCSCNHLTSFAILMDLSREELTDRKQAQVLTFITYIGCGISTLFLAVTLLTYLSFVKLLRDIPAKILVQLCLSLFLLNLVFLLDGWLALHTVTGLCISTGFCLHYFLLTSFTWAGLEALHMYLSIVKVFTPYLSRYMLKFSAVGWGVPLLVVVIIISVDKDNYGLVTYGKYTDGTSDDFCWLRNDLAFYVGVVAYFLLIYVLSLLVFIVVMVQLSRIKKQNPQNLSPNRGVLTDIRSIFGLVILLGLTWGFALFAWGPLYLPFIYLFAIFNSLQGFFVFVFHCAVKESVRREWRIHLCCGKLRLADNSDWSHMATQIRHRQSTNNNNRPMSGATDSTSAPHMTSRSTSAASNSTNSNGSVFLDSGISNGSNSYTTLNERIGRTPSP